MKNNFKNYYDNIEISDDLVFLTLNKFYQKRHFMSYKIIVSLMCVILIIGSFIYYNSQINYTSDFTIYSLENDEKKDITTAYTTSKSRIQIIDISQMSDEEKQKLYDELKKERIEDCYSSFVSESDNNNYLLYYYQNIYFDIKIKNDEHLEKIIIKNKSYDGNVTVNANGKSYMTESYDNSNVGITSPLNPSHIKTINISGEDFRNCEIYNRPFTIHWSPTSYLSYKMMNTPGYDVSIIKDEIDISLTYDNRKVVKNTLLITFNKEGYMSVKLKKK